MSPTDQPTLLVPVAESVTLRETVAHAVERLREAVDEDGGEESAPATPEPAEGPGPDAAAEGPTLHLIYVAASRTPEAGALEGPAAGRDLLDRAAVWVDEDLGEHRDRVSVETAVVGGDVYLFGPGDYAAVIGAYAEVHDVDEIVLDPEYTPTGSAPLLEPLAAELERGPVAVSEAPIERPARRTGLARAATLPKYAVVFGVSLVFYLAIGSLSVFDVVTGVATAVVVSALLAPVVLLTQPSMGRLSRQSLRMGLYVPYLLWEVAKANLVIAYVVLHPSLPIDPRIVEFRAAVWGDLPVTTLANSITLTPGTLTVDVKERSFAIHSLTPASRRDLAAGGLERAVRFVFWGRDAMSIPSPAERDRLREEADEGPEEATSP